MILAGIGGAAFGCLQFWLLKRTVLFLQESPQKAILIMLLKLLLYAAAIAALFLWFRSRILPAGIGLAAGMLGFSVMNFASSALRGKKK